MIPRIPHRVVLGPEWIIPVVQLPHAEYLAEADEEGEPEGHCSAAHFDIGERVMYLDRSLAVSRRWKAYRHELQHALLDIALMELGGV